MDTYVVKESCLLVRTFVVKAESEDQARTAVQEGYVESNDIDNWETDHQTRAVYKLEEEDALV